MQRIGWLAVALLPATLVAQQEAGTELWRLAATTIPAPPALMRGAMGVLWNPAQPLAAHGAVAVDAIETPASIGASGVLAVARVRAAGGALGFVYGRMELVDLVRTTVSPDPTGEAIPFYTQTAGVSYARGGATIVGASALVHDTRIDGREASRFTFDVGVTRALGSVVRLAAATHFLSALSTTNAAQELYAGAEVRMWHGPLWGAQHARFDASYGVTFARGSSADHYLGGRLSFEDRLAAELVLVREKSYCCAAVRGTAGIDLGIGRYRLRLARDTGVQDLGSAFRVGLEARLQ
ncbi:MAG TPA: hypothetical protein VI139_08105 [Gemmatimonadales bacterium]